jgi:hypothetical protein
VGDTVRRPVRPHTVAVESFLLHLEHVGFDGSPRVLGRDDEGRQVLSWIEGDVAVPPFPTWAAPSELLVSVADLQRRLHEASRSFVPVPDSVWDRANLPPPGPGAIVGHNDLCVENVVVRDGVAVAFIDFDFAAPTDPLLDIAIACRHWVPFKDPVDITDGFAGLDPYARFGMFCAQHGLSASERLAVIDHGLSFLDRAMVSMKARADAGQPLYAMVWANGYPEQNRRSHSWLAAQRHGGLAR